MNDDSEDFSELLRRNRQMHAGFFSWKDKPVGEKGAVESLNESLKKCGQPAFLAVKSRSNDPPDCEARSFDGKRIGIEVTELVDEDSRAASQPNRKKPLTQDKISKLHRRPRYAEHEFEKFIRDRIGEKDKQSSVKDGPYDEYVLIICCDEARALYAPLIEYLRGCEFGPTELVDRVFFLISYDPQKECCPFVELKLGCS